MTNIKIEKDKHHFEVNNNKLMIQKILTEKGKYQDEILERVKERDQFKVELNFLQD